MPASRRDGRGGFLGIPDDGREISLRMLHVFEFRDGRISPENVWLDGCAIVEQLTAADAAATANATAAD